MVGLEEGNDSFVSSSINQITSTEYHEFWERSITINSDILYHCPIDEFEEKTKQISFL